jgi:hypothetical protein
VTAPQPNAARTLRRQVAPLVAVIFALLAIIVILRGWQAARAISSPYELGYGEAQVRLAAEAFSRGEPLYPSLSAAPYRLLNYPPLYPAVAALAARLLGAGFAPGRILSWLASLLTALVIGALVRRETQRLDAALLAGGLYLASWNVDNVGHAYRVDSLAALLSVTGLALILRGGVGIWGGGLVFALAVLTRQSAVAAGLAGVVWLIGQKQRRAAATFAAVWIGAAVIAYGALTLATGGNFLTQAVLMLRTGWQAMRMLGFWGGFIRLYPVLLALGLVVGAFEWRRAGGPTAPVLYALFAALVSLSVGKSGSGENYLLETLIGLCLLGGLGWARMARPVVVRLLLLLQLVVMIPSWRVEAMAAALERQQRDAVSAMLPPAPAPILSEDPGVLLANGRTVWLLPYEFTQASVQGYWDQAPLVRAIEDRRFALLILQFDPWSARPQPDGTYQYGRFTAAMVDAIRRRYRPVRQVGYFLLLAPASDAATGSPPPA